MVRVHLQHCVYLQQKNRQVSVAISTVSLLRLPAPQGTERVQQQGGAGRRIWVKPNGCRGPSGGRRTEGSWQKRLKAKKKHEEQEKRTSLTKVETVLSAPQKPF